MGFGLLLLGYLLANDIMEYSIVPTVIGYALMAWGCVRLSEYDLKFKRCILPVIPLSILSVYLYANKICDYMELEAFIFPIAAVNAVGVARTLLSVCFLVLLMLAVASISKATELDKLAFRAVRNMLILVASEAIYLVALVLPAGQIANGMAYFAFIVRILRIVLDILLLFACYRMICSEGDEDMPAKEVKIPLLRKMEEVLNKRDKNAYDSAQAFKENRRKKKKNKKKGN